MVNEDPAMAVAQGRLWMGWSGEPMSQRLWDALVTGRVTDGGMAEAGWVPFPGKFPPYDRRAVSAEENVA